MNRSIVQLKGVSKKYGTVDAIKEIDLSVYEGAVSYTHLTLPTILLV